MLTAVGFLLKEEVLANLSLTALLLTLTRMAYFVIPNAETTSMVLVLYVGKIAQVTSVMMELTVISLHLMVVVLDGLAKTNVRERKAKIAKRMAFFGTLNAVKISITLPVVCAHLTAHLTCTTWVFLAARTVMDAQLEFP